MPDVNKGATLQQIYTWLYNGGSYGKKPTVGDMIDMGWLPLIHAGILYWEGGTNKDLRYIGWDTSGRAPVVEQYSSDIRTRTLQAAYAALGPNVAALMSGGATGIAFFERRVANVAVTLDAAGQALNTILIADPAGAYYGVVDSILIIPLAGCTIAGGITFAFESPAGTAIFSLLTTAIAEYVVNRSLEDVLVYNTTDNEALVVDLTGAGGAGDVGKQFIIQVRYHLET